MEVALPTLIGGGRYRLDALLGVGGMARVYRSWDARLEVDRAVKVIPAGGLAARGQIERLAAEARVMARLDHPGILRVHDVGVDERFHYVVMDLAPGGSVADGLRHGPLSPTAARDVLVAVAGALAAAHAAGVIHRDVKPQNVLIGAQGQPLLADFGIALLADDDRRMTRTNVAMGSVAYMAPEQRIDARAVGPAADVYAAGATLYHLLTCETPIDLFTAGPGSPRFEGLPPGLVDVIVAATRYEPGERLPSAHAFAAALAVLGPLPERAVQRAMWTPDATKSSGRTSSYVPVAVAPTRAPEATLGPGTMLEPARSTRPVLALAAATVVAGVVWGLGLAIGGIGSSAPDAPSAPPPAPVRPVPEAAVSEVPLSPSPVSASPEPAAPARAPAAPRRAVAPAPSTTSEAPAPEAAEDGRFPARWQGVFNGTPARLELTGYRRLTGRIYNGRGDAVLTEVSGRFDPDKGSIILEDVGDAPDLGRYTGALSADGARITGTHTLRNGARTVPFVFRRAGD